MITDYFQISGVPLQHAWNWPVALHRRLVVPAASSLVAVLSSSRWPPSQVRVIMVLTGTRGHWAVLLTLSTYNDT